MASKSLLKQTSKKPKKDKYSEISDIKKEYTYALNAEVIYLGLVEDYKTLSCSVVKRSRRKNTEYYNVKFSDGEELDSIANGFLKTPEEYEQYLLDQENNSEDNHDISDMERKIIESGKIPMKNFRSCHNQLLFYQRSCEQCHHEPVCIYHKKYMYDKVKFD